MSKTLTSLIIEFDDIFSKSIINLRDTSQVPKMEIDSLIDFLFSSITEGTFKNPDYVQAEILDWLNSDFANKITQEQVNYVLENTIALFNSMCKGFRKLNLENNDDDLVAVQFIDDKTVVMYQPNLHSP